MNEDRLRRLLREAPMPGGEDVERRALRTAATAFDERLAPRRAAPRRLAAALVAATLLTAALLTPAGAAVRDWIDDVFAPGVRDARPALTGLPGGGRLLVSSPAGSWVVQPDGSRRLIGAYREATWSPRGLFVAAVSAHSLNAVEPDGTPRWSLSAGAPVSDPRWSPSGFQIAYRAGGALRLVAANGGDEALLDRRVAPVPPAWSPAGRDLLAYVDSGNRLRVLDAAAGRAVTSAAVPPGTAGIGWSADGSRLLTVTPRSLLLRDLDPETPGGGSSIGPPRRLTFPAEAVVRRAAFSPRGDAIAVLLGFPSRGERPPHSEVLLTSAAERPSRRLFATPGRLADLAWSPDGRRLLIAWPEADQWLFAPAAGHGRVDAVSGIAGEFAPGRPGPAPFPRIDGWCCAATAAD